MVSVHERINIVLQNDIQMACVAVISENVHVQQV